MIRPLLRPVARRFRSTLRVTTARVWTRQILAAMASPGPSDPGPLQSEVCTVRRLETPSFRGWIAAMGEAFHRHRKLWEWGFICQALQERGCLRPGRRGLGFAVGREPLPSLFAQRGCEVLATDLPPQKATGSREVWTATGQHATSPEHLNLRRLCPADLFQERVRLRYLDMTAIPADLSGFDFLWSACALEHLGTLEAGMQFVERSLACLKPGGVAVHTTEFNVLSDSRTIAAGPDVLYRRRDIEELAQRLDRLGARLVTPNYFLGNHPADWWVDRYPYRSATHLKLDFQGYVVTSMGLIIEKSAAADSTDSAGSGEEAAGRRSG